MNLSPSLTFTILYIYYILIIHRQIMKFNCLSGLSNLISLNIFRTKKKSRGKESVESLIFNEDLLNY